MATTPDLAAFVAANDRLRPQSSPRAGVPFAAFFRPWVLELAATLPDFGVLSEHARAGRVDGLLAQLAAASANVLQQAFEDRRTASHSTFEQQLAETIEPDATHELDAFIADLYGGSFADLAREFSGWMPRIQALAGNWLQECAELERRLEIDLPAIERELLGREAGPVTRVDTGLGDPHHGGRSVSVLHFGSTDRVVYKPRALAGEVAFGRVIEWLRARDSDLVLPGAAATIDRGTHGWMQFVQYQRCESDDDIRDYYRRSGGLLALAHLLCATDCHHENIIGSGPIPVLVDAETLASPDLAAPRNDADTTANGQAGRLLRNSVLVTGLLPSWHELPTGDGYDSAGLGSGDFDEIEVVRSGWEHVNTDHQRRVTGTTLIRPLANVPRLGERPAGADGYLDEIVAGFEAVYGTVRAHSAAMCAPDGPLSGLARLRTRLILRPTQLYADLRTLSLSPEALAAPDAHFARLLQRGRTTADDDSPWSGLRQRHEDFVRAELASIRQLDIPRFEVRADDATIVSPPELSGRPSGAASPGIERVHARIRAASPRDQRLQAGIIRGALHCRAALGSLRGSAPSLPSPGGVEHTLRAPPLPDDDLRRWVISTVQTIADLAILGTDGTATWIVPAVRHSRRGLGLRPSDTSIYEGTGGIGIFLAAAAAVLGGGTVPDAEGLARAALRSLATEPLPVGIGGYTGLGGAIYALTTAGRILGDDELLDDAERLLPAVDTERIRTDDILDLVGGCAGLALALLALADATGSERAIDHARACCARVAGEVRRRVEAGEVDHLAGLAHGWSGLAVALTRFTRATGIHEFDDAIEMAIHAERSAYDPHRRNWLDLRDEAPEGSAMLGWCSGAPGVGLARLALGAPRSDRLGADRGAMIAPPLLDRVEADLDVAIRTTAASPIGTRDHLCCGTFGRVAFLAEAGRRRARPDLVDLARRAASVVLRRAETPAGLCFVTGRRVAADHLGMFQGTAGIGWQLLRFLDPVRVPEVLLLD